MEPELWEQVRAAQAGDPQAFAYLAAALAPVALEQARAIAREPQAAEDAVQQALLTALTRLDQLERPEAFAGWLLSIVRTAALKQGRRRRPDLLGAVAEQAAPDPEPGPAGRAERAELRALVRQAVHALPARERAVVEGYYLDGRSVKETAALLGLPAGTVKRRLHEARDRLRPRLLGLAPRADTQGRRRPGLRAPL